MNKFVILFAAPIGSSKSPISNYLSYKLNLPIFNNDIIYVEMKEDLLISNQEEFEKRRVQRLQEIVNSGISFIFDASIDRKWGIYKKQFIEEKGYLPFIISLDFSKEKLTEIYKAKGYTDFEALERTYNDHQKFLKEFNSEVSVHISDEQFLKRLEISYIAAKRFLERN